MVTVTATRVGVRLIDGERFVIYHFATDPWQADYSPFYRYLEIPSETEDDDHLAAEYARGYAERIRSFLNNENRDDRDIPAARMAAYRDRAKRWDDD